MSDKVIASWQEMFDQMAVVLEGLKGYQALCVRWGFSEQAAEAMAVQFHAELLKRMIK